MGITSGRIARALRRLAFWRPKPVVYESTNVVYIDRRGRVARHERRWELRR